MTNDGKRGGGPSQDESSPESHILCSPLWNKKSVQQRKEEKRIQVKRQEKLNEELLVLTWEGAKTKGTEFGMYFNKTYCTTETVQQSSVRYFYISQTECFLG